MKVRKMGLRKMQQLGSYRAPSLSTAFNKPRRGRVGKVTPPIKQFTKLGPRRGR